MAEQYCTVCCDPCTQRVRLECGHSLCARCCKMRMAHMAAMKDIPETLASQPCPVCKRDKYEIDRHFAIMEAERLLRCEPPDVNFEAAEARAHRFLEEEFRSMHEMLDRMEERTVRDAENVIESRSMEYAEYGKVLAEARRNEMDLVLGHESALVCECMTDAKEPRVVLGTEMECSNDMLHTLLLYVMSERAEQLPPSEDGRNEYMLGRNFLYVEDYEQATKWFGRARALMFDEVKLKLKESIIDCAVGAMAGDADEQFRLAEIFEGGVRITRNHPRAMLWYEKAAEQGNVHAMYKWGWCLQLGEDAPQDTHSAASWYIKAASMGHAEAQNMLGRCYLRGTGVEKDFVKAMEYFKMSAENGNNDAKTNFEWCAKQVQKVQRLANESPNGQSERSKTFFQKLLALIK